MRGRFLFLLTGICFLLASFIYAQEGKIVKYSELPAGWEYYQINLLEDIIFLIPMPESRADFLTEKYTSPTEKEKYLIRISYRYDGDLYEFKFACRGLVAGLSRMSEKEQKEIVKKERTGLIAKVITAELFDNLKNFTEEMSEVDYRNYYHISNDRVILFDFSGHKPKTMKKGKDLTPVIKENIGLIDKSYKLIDKSQNK